MAEISFGPSGRLELRANDHSLILPSDPFAAMAVIERVCASEAAKPPIGSRANPTQQQLDHEIYHKNNDASGCPFCAGIIHLRPRSRAITPKREEFSIEDLLNA